MNYSKELLIGLTTFAAVICFIWGYNFLKGKNIFTQKRDYYAFYENVHGLEIGQPVTINGFKIGQVTGITFDYSFKGPLLVAFHISKPVDFTSDTKVRIYDMDIMGAKGLQVDLGTSKLMASPGDTLAGDIQISLTEQVTKQFVPIKAGTERLVSVLDSTLRSITTLTDKASLLIEANHTNLTNAVENIDTLASVFTSQREQITAILNNMNVFTEDLVKANVDEAIGTLNKTMHDLNSILTDVKSGEGSLGKLIQDGSLYSEMNESLGQLELLLQDMRENPKRYVHFSLFGRKDSPTDTIN
ncbi:MAG: MlaD family protein [Flavobacteriales bacterium]|jgi:phospholipid/cholesterol/gamma-HCH transport system substrate-binding protein|tara:strand:+ start:6495 stop:7397 length:903 start_codon:yes stop_codon:yes gene_type:complete